MADLPEYKRGESLQPATSDLAFGKVAEKQASAGNFLTNIGSEIALRAGITRTAQAGIEMGKTPSGDLLPALNKTDEAFQNAYRTTAQSTLTLQGEELLNNGLITLNQANKLSPGLIDNFMAQMQKGIDNIAAQAPQMDRTSLGQSLRTSLITAEGKLQAKLAAQNKEDLKDTYSAFVQAENIAIFDTTNAGDFSGGQKKLDALVKSVQSQVASGLLDKLEALNIINTAKATYLTAREGSKALEARSKGQLDTFLGDWARKKPSELGMSPSEYVNVGQKLLSIISLQDSLDAKKQATLNAEIDLHIQRGDVSNSLIAKAEAEQTPENFMKTLTKIEVANQKNKKKLDAIKNVTSNWADSAKFSQFDAQDVNDSYDFLWKDLAQKQGLPEFAAKTLVAASAGGKIPDYIKELNALGSSPNAESLQTASDAIKHIRGARSANLDGIDSKVLSMINSFDRQRTANVDGETAAKNADKAVFQVDESTVKAREQQWVYINDNTFGKTEGKLTRGATDISGMKSSTDPIGFALRVQEVYKDTFLEVGNEIDAKKKLRDYFNAAYGETFANGFKEEGQFGTIEQALNITKSELPMVQQQIAEQAAEKIISYNEGNFAYKYKFKGPISVTLEERQAAELEYKEIQKTMQFNNPDVVKRYQELKDILKAGVNVSAREVEIISKEIQEIESRATLEEIVKSGRYQTLSQDEQIRLIKESYNRGQSQKKDTIDRLVYLSQQIKAIENPGRPILQQIEYDENGKQIAAKDYYVGIYRDPQGRKSQGQPIYFMRLINMDNRTENFTGVAQHNGGEVLYVPNTQDLQQKFGRYMHTANAGGEHEISQMRRKIQERALEAEKTVTDKQKRQIIKDGELVEDTNTDIIDFTTDSGMP